METDVSWRLRWWRFFGGVFLFVVAVVYNTVHSKTGYSEPVPYMTAGADSGVVVLRSALESLGIPVRDYDALRAECGVHPDGVSVDDLEVVAQRRGLEARQVMEPAAEAIGSDAHLPAIAVVDAPSGLDFWLLWRREGNRLLVMNPRSGNVWMNEAEVARALHIHEMDVPATPEALDSRVRVRRDGDVVHVRGAVIVTVRRPKALSRPR